MNHIRQLYFASLLVGLTATAFGQIPKAADAPRPLPSDQSAMQFKLASGFRLELVASEPLIREPSGVCWDDHGQLFVCELHGYNVEGHYDVEELNKTGQLDRVVRRIQANEEAKKKAQADTYGTVKRLLDVDDDGRMDRAEVWADRLPPCYGICAARGGIIVACAPDIVFLADRDGDGQAEVRETLFTGFETGPLERGINAPQYGIDNWIYFGAGHGGGTITGPRLKQPVELPHTDFRIRPDGTAIEPISGATLGMGFSFTESGERLVSTVSWPATYVVPLPWHYLSRNPYLATPPLNDSQTPLPPDTRTYPISRPHPWREKRANDPGFAKYYTDHYGIAESAPNGFFTSCCSPLVYQDVVLPGLHGQMLACEPAQNLITRMQLRREGLRLTLERVAGEGQSEFLASTDQWFHPIAMSHAPNGTIVICDFYREIIEDYSAIPRYLQQQYGLIQGMDHGRLWRLTHAQVPGAPEADMSALSAEQLAREIGSPYFWRRQTARRLLVERHAISATQTLAAVLHDSEDPSATLNALYTLEGLNQLTSNHVKAALDHAAPGVRVHGLRLAERWMNEQRDLQQTMLRLLDDEDPTVRLQLALSLGESRDERMVAALARLAAESVDEPWMATAIVSSAVNTSDELIAALVDMRASEQDLSPSALSILQVLASVVGSKRDDDGMGIARLLEITASLDSSAAAQQRLLDGLIEGLERGQTAPLHSAVGQQAILQLLSSESLELRRRALRVAGLMRLTESPLMKAAWEATIADALDEQLAVEERLFAISLMSAAPYGEVGQLKPLLDPRQPLDLQLAVVQSMSTTDAPQVVEDLLSQYAHLSPAVQTAVIDAICTRQDRLPQLLDTIERGVLSQSDVPALRRVQLLEHSNAQLRERAARLLTPVTLANRKEVLDRYQSALTLPRDATRGRLVFEQQCSKCHQLDQLGFAVGPDLDSVRTRPDESLLLDVLDPSGTINPKFRTYTVTTLDGRVFSGLLAGESATSITLRREKNETHTVLRKDIDEMQASSQSLMPEGIEKEITPQNFADLLAFLRESLPLLPSNLVLFDDEPEFLDKLSDGEGAARITTDDKSSGNSSLHLTSGQRHSARISGWDFRIVENPGPGEFRYLRLAWKSAGAAGVMVELADSGSWPPADSPTRRYCSGKNTSSWHATQISPDAPIDWTVVTVDLWRDFGDFTLTGIAPTAMNGPALFDRIELLRTLE